MGIYRNFQIRRLRKRIEELDKQLETVKNPIISNGLRWELKVKTDELNELEKKDN